MRRNCYVKLALGKRTDGNLVLSETGVKAVVEDLLVPPCLERHESTHGRGASADHFSPPVLRFAARRLNLPSRHGNGTQR